MKVEQIFRVGPGAVAAVVAALAIAGCGGSSPASTASATSSDTQDAARVKLAQCLRDNGVDVPDNPGQGGGAAGLRNVDRSKLQAAMRACRKYQTAAFGEVSPAQRQEFQDAFAKFSTCMRQHGVDVPNLTPGQGGPPTGGERFNRDDPRVQKAQKACQGNLPQGRVGGRPGPGN